MKSGRTLGKLIDCGQKIRFILPYISNASIIRKIFGLEE